MSLISSPSLSAPSPRECLHESRHAACPSSCASTCGVGLEKSLGSGFGKLLVHILEGECGEVSSTVVTLSTKIGMLDNFDFDYTRQEDVRTVVKTMMTARRMHRNRMHVYFKKFLSKEVALLKPHPDTTEEQWKELCDLFTSKAFMERMDAFLHWCDLEGKTYTEIEVYSKILGKKEGYVRGLGYVHQLTKARDEKEVMSAAREKDLQEFAKKQAEMEATLRTTVRSRSTFGWSRRSTWKRRKSACECSTRCARERSKRACEWSKSAYGQKYQRSWRKMSFVMEKKMRDMSKRLFS
ncbi:hypothetical protein CJ030_MR1G023587 [Morella rubra]|uniref:Uncharacterized protein n=1 Tax=Morella rubra TaxID=262757 RepID=A0A6A1WM40_9ROSI|nr:hypothetical protein CJ030_MR1G023587 [Morella rubra]